MIQALRSRDLSGALFCSRDSKGHISRAAVSVVACSQCVLYHEYFLSFAFTYIGIVLTFLYLYIPLICTLVTL